MDKCEVRQMNPEAIKSVRDAEAGIDFLKLSKLHKAIADPKRSRILHALLVESLCVCDLGALFNASSATISHHVRYLHRESLVSAEKKGKMVFYSLKDEHVIVMLKQSLQHIKEKE